MAYNKHRRSRITKHAKEFGKAVIRLYAPHAGATLDVIEAGRKLLKDL